MEFVRLGGGSPIEGSSLTDRTPDPVRLHVSASGPHISLRHSNGFVRDSIRVKVDSVITDAGVWLLSGSGCGGTSDGRVRSTEPAGRSADSTMRWQWRRSACLWGMRDRRCTQARLTISGRICVEPEGRCKGRVYLPGIPCDSPQYTMKHPMVGALELHRGRQRLQPATLWTGCCDLAPG
jgi:hypothetical protein